ncbi:hypothetical protein B0I35DRAFT_106719 [Stachybotrys elegans]|uniref:Uncharacterized protein n=1 Tax=Stachybotrys elegans TaxID=80388 RepID=A0A8K0WMQ5_9HYPO|nr:hypothetical protein B0I35DRAFT_106719 [Stachybotrys elegans]
MTLGAHIEFLELSQARTSTRQNSGRDLQTRRKYKTEKQKQKRPQRISTNQAFRTTARIVIPVVFLIEKLQWAISCPSDAHLCLRFAVLWHNDPSPSRRMGSRTNRTNRTEPRRPLVVPHKLFELDEGEPTGWQDWWGNSHPVSALVACVCLCERAVSLDELVVHRLFQKRATRRWVRCIGRRAIGGGSVRSDGSDLSCFGAFIPLHPQEA